MIIIFLKISIFFFLYWPWGRLWITKRYFGLLLYRKKKRFCFKFFHVVKRETDIDVFSWPSNFSYFIRLSLCIQTTKKKYLGLTNQSHNQMRFLDSKRSTMIGQEKSEIRIKLEWIERWRNFLNLNFKNFNCENNQELTENLKMFHYFLGGSWIH